VLEPAVGAFVLWSVGAQECEKVLDAGCGTGSLSATLASITQVSKIVGINPSKGFIEYARRQVADPRVIFEIGDGQNLPYRDASFDRCMALLAIDHIPDAPKATIEMRRVTKTAGLWEPPCGTVAATMSFTLLLGCRRSD
jgi:ubiquinone/menaquinone biosynthesis C-methylase UbiE